MAKIGQWKWYHLRIFHLAPLNPLKLNPPLTSIIFNIGWKVLYQHPNNATFLKFLVSLYKIWAKYICVWIFEKRLAFWTLELKICNWKNCSVFFIFYLTFFYYFFSVTCDLEHWYPQKDGIIDITCLFVFYNRTWVNFPPIYRAPDLPYIFVFPREAR